MIRKNKMKLYFLNINSISINDIDKIKKLFPLRYQKSLKMNVENDKLRSLGSTILINKAYPNINEDNLFYNECGKPLIKDGYFNISHDGDYVILVSDKNEVGIDMINIRARDFSFVKKVFTLDEINYANDDIKKCYEIWCKKESVVKLLGKGISYPLDKVNTYGFIKDNFIVIDNTKIYNKIIYKDDYVISISSFYPISEKCLLL